MLQHKNKMATNIQTQNELCILPVFSLRFCVMMKTVCWVHIPILNPFKIKVLSHSQSVFLHSFLSSLHVFSFTFPSFFIKLLYHFSSLSFLHVSFIHPNFLLCSSHLPFLPSSFLSFFSCPSSLPLFPYFLVFFIISFLTPFPSSILHFQPSIFQFSPFLSSYSLKNAGLFQPKFGSNMDKPKC